MNRYLKIFLAAASGAFVLLATVYLFRGVVIAPQLEKFLIQTASSAGIALTIKKTTGNYFSDLTFSEIEAIKTDNSAPQSAIRIKQISFRYDLKGLIHGLKPFISGLDIDIRQAEGSLNLDAITADNAAENQARQPSTYDWYPTLIPQIAVHDSTVSLVHNQQIIAINGINLALESGPTDKSRNVSLSINQISSNKKDTGFSMDSLRGQLALSRESILVSDLFLAEKSIIQTATIDLTGVGQDNISFTLTSDFLNGPLAMTGSIEKNLLHLQFDGQKLQLDNIAALGISPSLKQVEGVLDISGSLSLDIAKPDEFGTELTMNLHNGRFQDLFVDRFSLVATKTDDLIQLGRMNLFVGNNDLSVENAAIPYPALLNTDMVALTQQSKGSFSVSVKDLPALLKSVDYTPPAPLKTSDVYSIALSGNVDQGIVDISEGNILADTGSVIVQHSVINLSHTPIEPSTIRINTSLAVRISDLHAFLSPFAITDIYGSAEGRMTINGLLTDFTGSLTAKGQNLAYKQIALGNLDLQARASSGMINLESFSLNKDRDSISGSGTINIQKKTIDSLIL
ncbi:MAG: hypothetical protein KKE17_10215, partial [Proteobacteria bacterium]|nr:hypothetical protein [Pseudomonadota bacterium]MBU1710365.1 hypothetical protein [Pseudomonadota bacterium]